MSKLRFSKRVDDNQKLIVKQLRDLGYSVRSVASIGNGFPDIIVGIPRKNFLFEIKDGSKPPSARKLTPDEEDFFRDWKGQVDVAEGIDDILEIIQEARK